MGGCGLIDGCGLVGQLVPINFSHALPVVKRYFTSDVGCLIFYFLFLLQVRDRLPHLKMIVQYSPEPVDSSQAEQGVIPWEEFLTIGKVRVMSFLELLRQREYS